MQIEVLVPFTWRRGEVCVARGACMAKGRRGHAWQKRGSKGGHVWQEDMIAGETVTAVDGTHPTAILFQCTCSFSK